MLEKCKNTMTYSYIEYESPLSQHCWGRGFFLIPHTNRIQRPSRCVPYSHNQSQLTGW
nr:MAG TPA: hypothetical protein [Caudoviricetes sp.]